MNQQKLKDLSIEGVDNYFKYQGFTPEHEDSCNPCAAFTYQDGFRKAVAMLAQHAAREGAASAGAEAMFWHYELNHETL